MVCPYSRKCTYQMWECWMFLAQRSQTLVYKTPQGFLYDIWATMTPDLGYGPTSASQLSELHQTNHHTLVIAQVHAWCDCGAQSYRVEGGHAARVCAGCKVACRNRADLMLVCTSHSGTVFADSRYSVAPSDCCHMFPVACLRRFGLGGLPLRGTLSSLQTAFSVCNEQCPALERPHWIA